MITIPKDIKINVPNIIGAGIKLKEKVCIVAPGPNGVHHYHKIPNDFSVIAVNKAVLIEEIDPDWWVIAHTDTSWFHLVDYQYTGTRIYRDGILETITKTALETSVDNIYYFPVEKEPLQEEVVFPVEGCIRYGASVSALAIQLAYTIGAREILLCGVDMSGNHYWDKSQNEDPKVLSIHGKVWDSVKRLNPLIRYMRNELQVEISTLSKSELDVPFYIQKS